MLERNKEEISRLLSKFAEIAENKKDYLKEYRDLYLANREQIKLLDEQLKKEISGNNHNSSRDIAILLQGVIKLDLVNTSKAILENQNLLSAIKSDTTCFKSRYLGHGRNIFHLIKPITSQETYASIISLLKNIYPKNPETGQYPEELRELLIQQDSKGFNALHQSLYSANEGIAKEFISLLKEVYRNPETGQYPKELKELLTQKNKAGFTALHDALYSANKTVAKEFISLLKEVYYKDLEKLEELLTQKNNEGFTALHDALKSANEGVAKEFISLLKEVYSKNPLELRNLLTQQNKNGFTALHDLLKSANEDVAKNFISFLKDVYPKDSKTSEYPVELRNLLTQQNKEGFTALHDSLKSANEGVAREFTSLLKDVYRNPKTGEYQVELRKLLTQPNKNGFTPLHDALKSANEGVAREFTSLLKDVYPRDPKTGEYPEGLRNLLNQQNNEGFTPLHSALKSANEGIAKEFISLLKDVYSKDPKELKELLTQPNKKGFNALHHIASARNPVILYEFVNFTKEQLGEVEAMPILFKMANQGYPCPNCNLGKDNIFTDDMKNLNKGLAVLAGLDPNKEPDKYGRITNTFQKRVEWKKWGINYIDCDNLKLNPSKTQAEAKKFFENFNRVLQVNISPASASVMYQRNMPKLSINNGAMKNESSAILSDSLSQSLSSSVTSARNKRPLDNDSITPDNNPMPTKIGKLDKGREGRY